MSAENPANWRLQNASHLKGVSLEFRRYTRWSEEWDHDHCSGCWTKFAEVDSPGVQREGCATCGDYKHGAGYEWVCRECFDDLKADLGWTAEQGPSSATICPASDPNSPPP